MPTGSMPASDAAVTALPALSSPVAPESLRVEPANPVPPIEPTPHRAEPVPPIEPTPHRAEPVPPIEPTPHRAEPVPPIEPTPHRAEPVPPVAPESLRVEPAEPVPPVEGVLSVLCGARDVVARASRVPLGDADCDMLGDVVPDVASRLRSAADAVVLSATAALEAARPGSGRVALVGRARLSRRNAKRTVESSEQVAQMPNTARGLAAGALTAEHAQVLADAARRTSPDAVDTAAELLEAAAVVSPEKLR